jgi:hypothetical protein
VLLPSILVGLSPAIQASPIEAPHHGGEHVYARIVDGSASAVDVFALNEQLSPERVDNLVKFFPLVTPKGEIMPDESAEKKPDGGPNQGGARVGSPDGKEEIVHDWRYYLCMFLFVFSSSVLGGFTVHAMKYGLNEAWRDLVFGWPIPYWMRFVPKDERGDY